MKSLKTELWDLPAFKARRSIDVNVRYINRIWDLNFKALDVLYALKFDYYKKENVEESYEN